METPTVGKQLRLFRESRNMKQGEFCDYTGIKQQTISGIETGRSEPSTAMLQLLFQKFPDLNPDWLLLGTGPMLRGGKVLTPVAPQEPAAPTPGLVSGPATVAEAENILLRERIADKDVIIEMLRAELGKSNDSLDAADTTPTSPLAPRSSAGFKLTAIEKALRESFQEKQELVEAE